MGLTVAELEQEVVSQGAAQTGILTEVVDARGTAGTLGARLDVALNPDGTPRTPVATVSFVTEIAPIISYPPTGAYVALEGDLTAVYVAKRRLRINGALLPYVTSSTYDAGGDYTVVNFSTPVGNSITLVEYSFDPAAMPPIHYSGNPDIEQVVSGISTLATKHLSDAQYKSLLDDIKSLLDDIIARVTITSLASVDDGAGVDLVGRAFKYVDIIDDLRTLTPTDAPVYVQGHTVIDDSGHGPFVWDAESVLADNGGTVIAVSGVATGRWVRQKLATELTVYDFERSKAGLENYAVEVVKLATGTAFATITEQVTLPTSYCNISGPGDGSPIYCLGADAGFYREYTGGAWDDHPHSVIEKFRFFGDGLATLLEMYHAHWSTVQECVFQNADVGRLLRDSYTAMGVKNSYKGNRIGLHLTGVTSYVEKDIYAKTSTEAAIYISGDCENIKLLGGAIEGNHGCAIKVANDVTSGFRLLVDDVYIELCGDNAEGIPSIDIPVIDGSYVTFRGGKVSHNVSGSWVSGPYNLGYMAIFDGTRLDGFINAQRMSFKNGAYLGGAKFNQEDYPVYVDAFSKDCTFTSGRSATDGYTFSCTTTKKIINPTLATNLAPTTVPYAKVLGTGPTIVSSATLDYGDGDWSEIQFAAVAGAYGKNSAYIGNTIAGPSELRIHEFLVHSTTNTQIGLIESGSKTGVNQKINLEAGKIYKLVCFTKNTAPSTQRLGIYPIGTDAPVVSVLSLGQYDVDTVIEGAAIVSMIVDGEL